MRDKEMKECPFCGGEPYFHISSSGYGSGGMKIFNFQIRCRDCKISYPKSYSLEVDMDTNGELNLIKDERKEAIEAWNKRV